MIRAPTTLTVHGTAQSWQVRLKPNNRARRLILKVPIDSDMAELTVPEGTPRAIAERFLAEQTGWLAKTLAGRPDSIDFVDGAVVPLRGIDHRITHRGGRRGGVWYEAGEPTDLICVAGDRTHLARRVRDWLKAEARSDLTAAVMAYSAQVGARPTAIRVRDQRTRWGSCSQTGTLSFSWRIILAPPDVLSYLAAHEVAHLKELNHGPRFWALVRSLCPETDAARRWLKTNGPALHAYDRRAKS